MVSIFASIFFIVLGLLILVCGIKVVLDSKDSFEIWYDRILHILVGLICIMGSLFMFLISFTIFIKGLK